MVVCGSSRLYVSLVMQFRNDGEAVWCDQAKSFLHELSTWAFYMGLTRFDSLEWVCFRFP